MQALGVGDVHDAKKWRWEAMENGSTRMLSVHANCMEDSWGDYRFSNKIIFLKEISSWFVPDFPPGCDDILVAFSLSGEVTYTCHHTNIL